MGPRADLDVLVVKYLPYPIHFSIQGLRVVNTDNKQAAGPEHQP